MATRLPPLKALQAFEAASRYLSFTRAAEELHVTPAAVGQQVKLLEHQLGVALFRREGRQLRLTNAGQACVPELRDAFAKMRTAVDRALEGHSRGVLTLTVEPTFASRWLVRRLEDFREEHPEIDVRLDASPRITDLARGGFDAGIRYGAGRYPGLCVDKLFDEEVFPVCSPRLLEQTGGRPPLRRLQDLAHRTLLHEDMTGDPHDPWPDWETWLRAAGVSDVDPTRGPRFSQCNMLIDAAIAGQGVALTGHVLAADDLAAGRLVRPFGAELTTRIEFAYYLVTSPDGSARPKVAAFREWVMTRAQSERHTASH